MRFFLIVARDGAILLVEPQAPADCDEGAESAIIEIISAEAHDTIPCPPPEFDRAPDAAELYAALGLIAWHKAPAGQA